MICMNAQTRSLPHSDLYEPKPIDLSYLQKYQYKAIGEVGRGGYGIIYLVKALQSDNLYAVKVNFGTLKPEITCIQICYLILARHKRNLVQLHNIFCAEYHYHIVTEFFEHSPFISFLQTFQIIDAKHYLFELLVGLKSLKDLGIFHRDIKPSNFLYNPKTKKGVLADFGLAEIDESFVKNLRIKHEKDKNSKQLEKQMLFYSRISEALSSIGTQKHGTQAYMPIQSLLRRNSKAYSSDMWSVGVIFLQLAFRKFYVFNKLTRKKCEQYPSHQVQLAHLILELIALFGSEYVLKEAEKLGVEVLSGVDNHKGPDSLQEVCSMKIGNDGEDLLRRMLSIDPKKRITVEQALAHEFFDDIRKPL